MNFSLYLRVIFLLLCSDVAWSDKTQTCEMTGEGTGFGNQLVFTDTCTTVCIQACGEAGSACETTVALDKSCDELGSCGTTGCECFSQDDLTAVVNTNNFQEKANPIVECGLDFFTYKFSKCAANAYGFYLEHMFLDGPGSTSDGTSLNTDANNNCRGTVAFSGSRMMYEFKITGNNSACNTDFQFTGGNLVYTNAVRAFTADSSGLISRDRTMDVEFTCTFSATLLKTLEGAISPLITSATADKLVGTQEDTFTAIMGLWSDEAYTTPISSGASVDILDYVYVGLTTTIPDTSLLLVVLTASVTSSADPNDANKVDLIIDQCPVDTSVTGAVIIKSGVDPEVRFKFPAFYFTNLPENQTLWVHCTIKVCYSAADCPSTCGVDRRRRRSVSEESLSISVGPLKIYSGDNKDLMGDVDQKETSVDGPENLVTKLVASIEDDNHISPYITLIALVVGAFVLALAFLCCRYFDSIVKAVKPQQKSPLYTDKEFIM